jgi:DMT superfamily drug/metabolite transporter
VLFAALLGFVVFGEIPDVYSFVGYALIFGTALWKWKQTGSENASPLEKRVADMRAGKNIHEHELLEEE